MKKYEREVRNILLKAGVIIAGKHDDGIKFNPSDIKLLPYKGKSFFKQIYKNPLLGLPESYMREEWECDDLTLLLYKLLTADLENLSSYSMAMKLKLRIQLISQFVRTWIVNSAWQSPFTIGQQHYNKGNYLFKVMLGKDDMTYSCGLWEKGANNLKQAHLDNFTRAAEALELRSGMTVVDIGCGFGSFAKFAAENYGVRVVGLTVSEQQARLAREFCRGLPVEIRLQDYRKLKEKFDTAVSFGMFEHVHPKNYKRFFQTIANNLESKGKFFLHSIASFEKVWATDMFTSKYIFPNSYIPTKKQILNKAIKYFEIDTTYDLVASNYTKTLEVWYQRFKDNWDVELKDIYFDKGMPGNMFYRMWEYYLCSCLALFKVNGKYVQQVVLIKK